MRPELSIVTGTKNRPHSLRRLLESILATASVSTEIIVADASDNFEKIADFKNWNDNIFYIEHYQEFPPFGTVKGYNFAFRRANGRLVCWMNDDCECVRGWDRIAVDFMDKNPCVGCGVIYFKDQGMGGYYVQEQPLAHLGNIVTANFGVVPRELGNQIGWFDEREVFIPELGRSEALTHYGCDNSLCCSVLNAGFAVCQIPGCKVIHHREHDESRREKMDAHMNCAPLPPGSKSGRILSLLWNGEDPSAPGYQRIKETYDRFKHLIGPIHIGD